MPRWLLLTMLGCIGCHSGDPFVFGGALDSLAPGDAGPGSASDAIDVCVGEACCNRACGRCEVCAKSGNCEPSGDCTFASCDAGICLSVRAPLGVPCNGSGACASGFCVDGVCCESACEGVCQACGAGGLCNAYPARDLDCEAVACPEVAICREQVPPSPQACASFGQCATTEDCVTSFTRAGVSCAPGLLCDGIGACSLLQGAVVIEPEQVCPAPGGGPLEVRFTLDEPPLDGPVTEDSPAGTRLCFVGQDPDNIVMGKGEFVTGTEPGSVVVGAYIFDSRGPQRSVKTQLYDAEGVALPGCFVVDTTRDAAWTTLTFTSATCRGAAFARVMAYSSLNAGL